MQGSQRGVISDKSGKDKILTAVEALAAKGADQETTTSQIDATWKLLWTTEKVGNCGTRINVLCSLVSPLGLVTFNLNNGITSAW